MKKKRLFAIAISVIIIIGLALFLVNSYDFTPSTRDNPHGLDARVVKTIWNPTDDGMWPPELAETRVIFRLYHNSKDPLEYFGYNICSGVFCIKEESGQYGSVRESNLGNNMQQWPDFNIASYPWWNAGDTVNIRIKVKPTTMLENGTIVGSNDNMIFIDLGESQILEWEFGGSK